MANDRKSTGKSVESPKEFKYKLYFNKNCDCSEVVNEHLLPDSVHEKTLSKLFIACIENLISANIRLDATKFATKFIREIGNYYKIDVKNSLHLQNLLKKLCKVLRVCPNFIAWKKIGKCSLCDDDEDEEEGMKKAVVKEQKKTAPKKQREVVLDAKKLRVSLKRMDFSKMELQSEITLPPNSPNDTENNNNNNNNSVIVVGSSSQNANDVLKTPSTSQMPFRKINVLMANSVQNSKDIALKSACTTLVTVQSNRRSSNASDSSSLAPGDWSMEYCATPHRSRVVAAEMSVDQIVEVFQSSKSSAPTETSNPIVGNVLEENVTELEDIIEVIENEVGTGEEDGGGGTQNEEIEFQSVHLSSDGDEDVNDVAMGDNAETESRAYDTQDEMEQMDDVDSDVDPSFICIDWNPDQVADFVIVEDPTLQHFAHFIRNERIDGSQVPFIKYRFLCDSVPSSPGEKLRILRIVEKMKNLLNFSEKQTVTDE